MEFDDVRDAEDAIHEMNGERLCGDRITVELARGTVARQIATARLLLCKNLREIKLLKNIQKVAAAVEIARAHALVAGARTGTRVAPAESVLIGLLTP